MRGVLTAWGAVAPLAAPLDQVAFEKLWLLAMVPTLAWAFAGSVILLVAVWRARKVGERPRDLVSAPTVLVGWLLFVPIARIGGMVTNRIRFSLDRTAYEGVVARETAKTPVSGSRTRDGLDYVVDAGPPTRIAFVWPGGIVDNGCGAVYDPTGAVLRSLDSNGPATGRALVPVGIRELFGGDLSSCRELDAPFDHRCST